MPSPNVECVVAQEVCIGGIRLHAGGQGLGVVSAQAPAGHQRSKVPEEDTGICAAAASQGCDWCVHQAAGNTTIRMSSGYAAHELPTSW